MGVHPHLRKVVKRAITLTDIDFVVLEGVRSLETQKKYVAAGVSWTLKSYHLIGPDGYGHAVDLACLIGNVVRWEQPLYDRLAVHVKKAAADMGVKIQWGYDLWGKDGAHWQLSKAEWGV